MRLLENIKKTTIKQMGNDISEDDFMFVGAVFSSDLPAENSRLRAFQNALGIHPCETVFLKKVNWAITEKDPE